MPFATAVGAAVAGAVVSGAISSDASRKASNTQRDAANQATAVGAETADKQLGLQREQFDRQEALTREQMARDRQIYDDNLARSKPAYDAGLRSIIGFEDQINNPFQYDKSAFDLNKLQMDPGWQFRTDQGNKALTRQLNSTGNLYSGAAGKALIDYNQGAASQEYGAAYGRAADQQARSKDAFLMRTNALASLAGIGQVANNSAQVAGQQYGQSGANALNQFGAAGTNYSNQSSNALGNYGNNAASNLIGTGNARAANSMYQGNTWQNAINQGASAYGRSGSGGSSGIGGLFGIGGAFAPSYQDSGGYFSGSSNLGWSGQSLGE